VEIAEPDHVSASMDKGVILRIPNPTPNIVPRLLLLLPALAGGLIAATAAAAAPDADPELERAARLRDEARTLRMQADDTLATRLPACYERFLVNRCIADEKDARLEAIRRARELEGEASRIELAQKQRIAAEQGRSASDAPTEPATPAEPIAIEPDSGADATRNQRDADAAQATAARQAERQKKDAEKAAARTQAEAEAADRAAAAARDRARYEERMRKREADKAQ
jgi:hypothetical protein